MSRTISKLKTIIVSNQFNTDKVTSSSGMFTDSNKLVGGAGTAYNSSYTDKGRAKIDGGTEDPGYFTNYTDCYTVHYNTNSGTGTMADQLLANNDYEYNLRTNAFTKQGYIFDGWSVSANGEVVIEAEVNTINSSLNSISPYIVNNEITLYAKWVEPYAKFTTGSNVNVAIKKLTGQTSATKTTANTTITSIQYIEVGDGEGQISTSDYNAKIANAVMYNGTINASTAAVNVSANEIPIYMWYENGIIYWHSDANTIYLNEDSSNMFMSLQGLTDIDLNKFNTRKTTNMSYMFQYCTSLTSLDLSGFNTKNVTKMESMFSMSRTISKLKTIFVSNQFNTDKVTSSTSMFASCSKLVGGAGTTYNSSYIDKTRAKIDGGTSDPGYFTEAPTPAPAQLNSFTQLLNTNSTTGTANVLNTNVTSGTANVLNNYSNKGWTPKELNSQ